MRTIPLTVVVVTLVALAPITGVAAIQEPTTGPLDQTATNEAALTGYGPVEEPSAGEDTSPSSSPGTATVPADDWSLLLEDSTEDPAKIETVYTQRTDQTVYFKVEYANITTHDSFDLGVFIDADQSTETGLNSSQEGWYNVTDIGADYVAVVGSEGDALWEWDEQNQTWPSEEQQMMDLAYKDIQYTQDTVVLGIDREKIDNPDAIDVVFAEARHDPWDYVPDEGDGHVTVELTDSSDSSVTVPFTEEFESGLNGWTIANRMDSDASTGGGQWVSDYGGSVKLHVDGSPSTIQMYESTEGIPSGTTITANYAPERFEYVAAGAHLFAVKPDGERIHLDTDNDQEGGNYEQNGTLRATVQEDYPAGTEIEIKLTIWPGETSVYVTNVTAATTTTDDGPTAAFSYEPQLPTTAEQITFNGTESAPQDEITNYEWDFEGDGTVDATGVTAAHVFDSAGEHNVTLTVTDAAGQTDTTTQTVQVVQSDQPTVYLEPVNGTVSVNGTTTYSLKMSNVDGGVGAFDPVNVTLEEPATVSIQEVSTPFSGANTMRAADGTQASVTLPFGGETADTGTVKLATLTVRGEMPGKTTAQVTVTGDIARENGSLYENVSSVDSVIHTRTALPPVVGENAPTNTDGDGRLEDVNGNSDFDIGDIQALFANRDSDAVRNNAAQFDFNNNGGIDIGDIQALFQEYMQS